MASVSSGEAEERREKREEEYTYTYIRVRILKKDPLFLTRIATAIDCEGSVFIAERSKRGKNHRQARFVPTVKISNKPTLMLERILKAVGFGSIQTKGKNHDQHELVWQSRQALAMSQLLVTYCWLKAEGMREIIDFYKKKEKLE